WRNEEEKERAKKGGMDISEEKVYTTDDLAPGDDIIFVATGVTKGDVLEGVSFFGGGARTYSMVLAAKTREIRFINTIHLFEKIDRIRLR
ncbi:fructose-bisphosphatase class II, partial [Thermodesulfovibrionales bacterium]|nr:fructose-bisphosphatase class II [Thermodesulfovibrionales bacterium]